MSNLEQEFDGLPLSNQADEVKDSDISSIKGLSLSEDYFSNFANDKFSTHLLATAISYIGVSRDTNLPQVAKFLSLFNLPTKEEDKWVPFCASGISYAACKTYCDLNSVAYTEDNSVSIFKSVKDKIKSKYFLPSPSCGYIMNAAKDKKNWMDTPDDKTKIKAGDLILYSWSGSSWPDHIGIVEFAENNVVHTVEFNTSGKDNRNGGCVSRRIRNYDCVLGFVRLS